MSAAHTPGPWVWHDAYTLRPVNPNPAKHSVHTILSEDGPYGFVQTAWADIEPEDRANRALIAAAPELLGIAQRVEALLAAQRWLPEGNDPEAALLRDARAAIARATEGAA